MQYVLAEWLRPASRSNQVVVPASREELVERVEAGRLGNAGDYIPSMIALKVALGRIAAAAFAGTTRK